MKKIIIVIILIFVLMEINISIDATLGSLKADFLIDEIKEKNLIFLQFIEVIALFTLKNWKFKSYVYTLINAWNFIFSLIIIFTLIASYIIDGFLLYSVYLIILLLFVGLKMKFITKHWNITKDFIFENKPDWFL